MEKNQCECCHNVYDKAFTVIMSGQAHVFDSFECAISSLAPHCTYCNVRILGHGLEENGQIFCCAHCARHVNETVLKDRAN